MFILVSLKITYNIMKNKSIKENVKSISFSYKIKSRKVVVSNIFEILVIELFSVDGGVFLKNTIDTISKELFDQSIVRDFESINISIKIRYNGTESTYLIDSKLDVNCEKTSYIKEYASLGFLSLYSHFVENFYTKYGIYVPPIHFKNIDSCCTNCNISFDGGSIFENFYKQGVDGVEYYKKHPNEILLITEESYSEPYRFSNILLVKNMLAYEFDYYECPNCSTKQNYS